MNVRTESPYLSTKDIPVEQRLIVAVDVPGADAAKALVTTLGDAVVFYKIGLELCMSGDYFELLAWLRERGKHVFADLKFYDIPNTVASAVARLADHDVQFATVHGDDSIMAAAAQSKRDVKIMAVTVLTSLDEEALHKMGFAGTPAELALSRAASAMKAGCDGIISSGHEVGLVREQLGDELIVVCPGIRPTATDDDQKRTVTVEQAFRNGADYIVVGRPVRGADDPRRAAQDIQASIASVFE